MRSCSSASSATSSRVRLLASTRAIGSTKIVSPEPELSWTMPGTAERDDAFTASTGRPPRSVVNDSCRWGRSRTCQLAQQLGGGAAGGGEAAPDRGELGRGGVEEAPVRVERPVEGGLDAARAGGDLGRLTPPASSGAGLVERSASASRSLHPDRDGGEHRQQRLGARASRSRAAWATASRMSYAPPGGRRPRSRSRMRLLGARRSARPPRPGRRRASATWARSRPPANEVRPARRSRTTGSSSSSALRGSTPEE